MRRDVALMTWYADFESELLTTVAGAFPDCGGRVFTSLQSARENLLAALDAGRLSLPCAFVQIGRAVRADDFGLHNRSYRLPVTVVRLCAPGTGVSRAEMARMDALALAIERAPHLSFRAIEAGEPDAEETNAALAALIDAKMGLYASALTYSPGLLSGDFSQ